MISIIVPVYNSSSTLRRCLEAIYASSYRHFECIVIDDGSSDASPDIAQTFPSKLERLRGGPFGPAYARNRGAELAQGRILFFIDADVVVHPGTLAELASTFARMPDVSAVFGSYDDGPEPRDFLSQYKNLFHHFVHQVGEESAATFWAGCGAVRKDAFVEVGGFAEGLYSRPSIEDIELGYRLRASGKKILLNKALQAKHLKRWSFGRLLKSDILDRGIPWTRLILRARHLPNDLNLRSSQRLSAVLACMLMPTALVGFTLWREVRMPFSAGLLLVGASLMVLVSLIVYLNRELYRFFVRKRGVAFAAASVPFHLLYFVYSVGSFGIGFALHTWERFRPPTVGARRTLPGDTA